MPKPWTMCSACIEANHQGRYAERSGPQTEDLHEVEVMLANRMKWERDFERAGMQRWMREDREQGLQEG